MENVIVSFSGKYRFLSNFYPCRIVFDGTAYPSVEHAYVASKTLDSKKRKEILELTLPGEVKKLGRKIKLRPSWDTLRLHYMRDFVTQKFQGDTQLANLLMDTYPTTLLMDTYPTTLIEGNHWGHWGDTFWGVYNGEGQNHLGKILMDVRKCILENTQ